MTPKDTLQLANSLLEGSSLQEGLRWFQRNIRKTGTGQLTESWQKGLMSRHDAFLQTKRGYHVNHLRMDDLTGDNVEAMYDMTYKTWTAARCAVRLPEDKYHYVDASGNRTTKGNAAGRLVKYKITHPEWILHGDEVGTAMCQEDDGPIGGQL